MTPVDDLHTAVRALTEPRRLRLHRDHGSQWVTVPSLWTQLLDAAGTGSERENASSGRWRTPVDLDALDLRTEILEVTADALREHGQKPRDTLPDSLRLLAATIATDETAWWTYRVDSWTHRTSRVLGLSDDPQPRRIRDTPCPTCQTSHVTVWVDGEKQRAPALLIDFQAGRVTAAQCSACGDTWWRGESLHLLAEAIHPPGCATTP